MHEPIDPLSLSRRISDQYSNQLLGRVNDHEIRMSVMTEQYRWHQHPDSDETFFGVDGELIIEFDGRQIIVQPGHFVTVPAGTTPDASVRTSLCQSDIRTYWIEHHIRREQSAGSNQ